MHEDPRIREIIARERIEKPLLDRIAELEAVLASVASPWLDKPDGPGWWYRWDLSTDCWWVFEIQSHELEQDYVPQRYRYQKVRTPEPPGEGK